MTDKRIVKQCPRCNKKKDYALFLPDRNLCKECHANYARQYRKKNRDKYNKYQNQYMTDKYWKEKDQEA